MKKLFAVLLAVAMLLSLSVVAFAGESEEPTTGTIVVANAGGHTYKAYKIFTARVDDTDNKIHYTVDPTIRAKIDTADPSLGFIYNAAGEIEADAGFSAADFAAWLIQNMNTLGLTAQDLTTATGGETATLENVDPGYYLVVPTEPANPVGALATVIPGKTTQVQNKNDMPLDKEVERGDTATGETPDYDDNGEGVKVGDTLNYKITAKTPATYKDNDYDYTFLVTDKMTDGLTFNDDLTITIGKKIVGAADDASDRPEGDPNDLPAIVITVKKDGRVTVNGDAAKNTDAVLGNKIVVKNSKSTGAMGPNEVRFGAVDSENGGNFIFEVSLAVANAILREYKGVDVTITYSATVNDNATAQLLQNTAVLTYGDDNNLIIKDAETDNYISRIVVDKFETGNRTQKLPGAQFRLYKQASEGAAKQYYKLNATNSGTAAVKWANTNEDWTEWSASHTETTDTREYFEENVVGTEKTPAVPASGFSVSWVAENQGPTVVTTDENGYAEFPYLEDGTYYLEEIKAPVDYTRLLGPIKIVVDGSDAVDGRLTHQQRVDALTNVANVANNPGSTMPSTGGVGATMLTIGGVALILAAGAYLVLRKRQEN